MIHSIFQERVKPMNKFKRLLAKAKVLSEELSSITYEECKEFYRDEKTFNTEMKQTRLDLNYVYEKLEVMVHCTDGEYSCIGCGKWFTPPVDMDSNVDYICSECEEKFSEETELEKLVYTLQDDGLVVLSR
ncbi:hypothetical protein Desdi_1098 [Desulfitobacterium dichloroeliminans LMG P-21439]|uniref:Uncharacterized protein n=1 Tax=Desulfitobacterium dichloroeliminans (strain LMG P-21439 / DCA1) TaxID=871963 RepID=L0F6G9_DESDL|nr:hypothetical protein [Desulfitobacterium dichloroeliminans]AGA68615.1 hypothetical protein Desdi_1098 [Desulfitobacterium dichloroeliminans LMG P-21439]